MKTFNERLKYALELRDMKPSVLSYKTNISEASLSHYIKGHYEPKIKKLKAIAAALRVSDAWLNGFDVPMESENSPEEPKLSEGEQKLIDCYRRLPEEGQKSLNNCIASLGNFSEETQMLALRMLRSVLENQ